MNSTKQAARIAGVLYLVNGATGFFGIIYVPSKLIVSGNAAATMKRARTSLCYSQRKTFAESAVQTRNTRASAATSPKCADHGSPCQIPASRETA